jgi:hypothetical protein
MITTNLTATQQAILTHAIDEAEGRIEWFPDNVKGGPRGKVLTALSIRGLAVLEDGTWRATPAAYAALGRDLPPPAPITPDQVLEADVAAAEATFTPAETPRRTRENTKQARVIAMLRRPEGATIAQIQAATRWQAHTVRGHFAGSLRKKLGLNLVSEKVQGQDRVYRLAD